MQNKIATARWADPDYIANKYEYEQGAIFLGRHPHDYNRAIGYKDDRHVFVCSGSRGGKGRSLIVNNLALWTGSTLTYDPKGDLPAILAPRRGEGNKYCEGLQQDTFVLDPLGISQVEDQYKAYFNPFEFLDPKDDNFSNSTMRIARSLMQLMKGSEAGEWTEKAIQFTEMIIRHVATSEQYKGEKNIVTVLKLIMEGAHTHARYVNDLFKQQGLDKRITPLEQLFQEMEDNTADDWLPIAARGMRDEMEKVEKFMQSVRSEASSKLSWIKNKAFSRIVTGDNELKPLNPKRLKEDKISVFIVLPTDYIDTYGSWLQMLFKEIFSAVNEVPGKPYGGEQILTVLDEFSSLGYQEYIERALDYQAGKGIKFMIIVQNFGILDKLYGKGTESFISNSGIEIYTGKIANDASKYLKEQLGEMQVTMYPRNVSQQEGMSYGRQEGTSTAHSEQESQTHGHSQNHTSTHATNESTSKGSTQSRSKQKGRSSGSGRTWGDGYGPHVFFQPLEQTTNYGRNLNRTKNSGTTSTFGNSFTQTSGSSDSNAFSQGETQSDTHTFGKTTTVNTGTTTTHNQSYGKGFQEQYFKKPLLDIHEIRQFFQRFNEEDIDEPSFPGMSLILLDGEPPTFVRKCNYDQDPILRNKFSPDSNYKFIPFHELPRLGCLYDDSHFFSIKIPAKILNDNLSVQHLIPVERIFKKGDELFYLFGEGLTNSCAVADFKGRVIDTVPDNENGHIMTVRSYEPIDNKKRMNLKRGVFENAIKSHNRALERIEETSKQIEEQKKAKEREERHKIKLDKLSEIDNEIRSLESESINIHKKISEYNKEDHYISPKELKLFFILSPLYFLLYFVIIELEKQGFRTRGFATGLSIGLFVNKLSLDNVLKSKLGLFFYTITTTSIMVILYKMKIGIPPTNEILIAIYFLAIPISFYKRTLIHLLEFITGYKPKKEIENKESISRYNQIEEEIDLLKQKRREI